MDFDEVATTNLDEVHRFFEVDAQRTLNNGTCRPTLESALLVPDRLGGARDQCAGTSSPVSRLAKVQACQYPGKGYG